MLEGGQPEKPAILVLSAAESTTEIEVLAGIEEEGVPYVLERTTGDRSAVELARRAAEMSSLEVGVGADRTGRVAVMHAKLPGSVAGLFSEGPATPAVARVTGHNAARIVVGVPLRAVPR